MTNSVPLNSRFNSIDPVGCMYCMYACMVDGSGYWVIKLNSSREEKARKSLMTSGMESLIQSLSLLQSLSWSPLYVCCPLEPISGLKLPLFSEAILCNKVFVVDDKITHKRNEKSKKDDEEEEARLI